MRYSRAITVSLLLLGFTLIVASSEFGTLNQMLEIFRSLVEPILTSLM